MQRREFTALSLSSLAGLPLTPALAQAAAFKDGTDYLSLKTRVSSDVGKGKIEVAQYNVKAAHAATLIQKIIAGNA